MNRFHPFFSIGTVGIIVVSLLHIWLALGLSITAAHSIFLVLYPMFIAFLAIGFALTLKEQNNSKKA